MASILRQGGIVLCCALVFLAATATAVTGTIQITVHPGGGTVCLGTDCKECPAGTDGSGSVAFDNVEAGSYHMLNIYNTDGYKPWLGQIYLDPSGAALSRDIVLEKLPSSSAGTGSVQVYVTPDGGRVCLNKMCEMSSGDGSGSWSVQFTDVAANTYHTLTISHEGYETYTTEVRLLPGQASTLSVTLQPLPPGSTTVPTPAPTPVPTPSPTRSALPAGFALTAIGICCAVVCILRRT